MMLHHNTKFRNQMLDGLEHIWTNTDILTLHCDLDLECSHPILAAAITIAEMLQT